MDPHVFFGFCRCSASLFPLRLCSIFRSVVMGRPPTRGLNSFAPSELQTLVASAAKNSSLLILAQVSGSTRRPSSPLSVYRLPLEPSGLARRLRIAMCAFLLVLLPPCVLDRSQQDRGPESLPSVTTPAAPYNCSGCMMRSILAVFRHSNTTSMEHRS